MAKINLLPWRQELRKQRQQEFVAIVLAVAVLAVGIVLFTHMALSKQVSDQLERNSYIKAEIATLDTQIKEIDELQKRRDELLSRMRVIQDLQGHRPVIVRVFDEFVRAMPDGVYFRTIERKENMFSIVGVAESANQVSNLMRNLEASQWFKSPVLSKVAAEASKDASVSGKPGATAVKGAAAQAANTFALTVMLDAPESAIDAEEKKDKTAPASGGGATK
ncbi:MAG TPA: PilN domain-containing protein [Moraxellaceae bacterium]|jgi:type IV pilus assembly protein PilN|nr:PilN domain-containing protein [Moraxellaceae bacterium]HQV40946.1 PilN domain-containing protein [Moraxellaceae bacterium]HQX90467.1 PilN domain-containing protein [Moraxellaceae bacterium]